MNATAKDSAFTAARRRVNAWGEMIFGRILQAFVLLALGLLVIAGFRQ